MTLILFKFIVLSLILAPFQVVFAEGISPERRQSFCQQSAERSFFKSRSVQRRNRIAFRNHGGLLNSGVCWWHSRLERSATYLTVFRPDLPKPTESEANRILTQIMRNTRVVEIPGYTNFQRFTADWDHLVQKRLERWQIFDGFVKQAWINGLIGSSSVSPENMIKIMEELYTAVEQRGEISYVKLQLPGIISHAWLVVDMNPTEDGYILTIVDSNFSSPGSIRYRFGDRYLNYRALETDDPVFGSHPESYQKLDEALEIFADISSKIKGSELEDFIIAAKVRRGEIPFVPYLQRERDFKKISKALISYCGN